MIVIPASLRSDFIHIAGMTIHIALESTIHIVGIRISARTEADVPERLAHCAIIPPRHQHGQRSKP
jgi:hypothetical protein